MLYRKPPGAICCLVLFVCELILHPDGAAVESIHHKFTSCYNEAGPKGEILCRVKSEDADLIFFFWSLFLSGIMSLAVLALLFKALRINWERRNRVAWGYLAPVALTGLFLALMLSLTVPRLLDTVNLLTESFAIDEVAVDQESLGWNSLNINGRRYFYSQWQLRLEPGQHYRIEFTPRSGYLVRATPIETAVVNSRNLAISNEDAGKLP